MPSTPPIRQSRFEKMATHSPIEPMKQVAYTIKGHWNGILNWLKSNVTNGILEGINSMIISSP